MSRQDYIDPCEGTTEQRTESCHACGVIVDGAHPYEDYTSKPVCEKCRTEDYTACECGCLAHFKDVSYYDEDIPLCPDHLHEYTLRYAQEGEE